MLTCSKGGESVVPALIENEAKQSMEAAQRKRLEPPKRHFRNLTHAGTSKALKKETFLVKLSHVYQEQKS